MSSQLPPTGAYQPQEVRPGTNRTRTNSATADKYRPRTYSHPPPTQPDPHLLGPQQRPYAPPDPSVYPQTQARQPPYPEHPGYANGPLPMPQPAPPQSYPNPPTPSFGPSSRHSSYTDARPPLEDDYGRRPSYSSQRSHRSYDSRHSRDSRRSRHSRHSVAEERRESKSHGDRARKDHPKRTNERPTMADSLVSMFDLIKSALGPRDK